MEAEFESVLRKPETTEYNRPDTLGFDRLCHSSLSNPVDQEPTTISRKTGWAIRDVFDGWFVSSN